MPVRNYSNTATQTTVTSDLSSGTTTVPVASTTGFPAAPFYAVIDRGTVKEEVVYVTNVAGLMLTASRGQDGTAQTTHSAGAAFEHAAVAADLREANAHIEASQNVHGVGVGNSVASNADIVSQINTHAADTNTHGLTIVKGNISTIQALPGPLVSTHTRGSTFTINTDTTQNLLSTSVTLPTYTPLAGGTGRWVAQVQGEYLGAFSQTVGGSGSRDWVVRVSVGGIVVLESSPATIFRRSDTVVAPTRDRLFLELALTGGSVAVSVDAVKVSGTGTNTTTLNNFTVQILWTPIKVL